MDVGLNCRRFIQRYKCKVKLVYMCNYCHIKKVMRYLTSGRMYVNFIDFSTFVVYYW
jgi:hypothetical protein